MARKLRPATYVTLTQIDLAEKHARYVVDFLDGAECTVAAKKARSLLKSIGGARRHAERRLMATEEESQS